MLSRGSGEKIMFNHILLEVHCHKESNDDSVSCCGEKTPTYRCLLDKCPYLSFTSHENAMCYIGDSSEAETIISLGGEMLSESCDEEKARLLWRCISEKKIEEAYNEYMNEIKMLGERE